MDEKKIVIRDVATIEGTFPEVKGNCYARGRGEGSSKRIALQKAIGHILGQKNLKGKKITRFTAVISFGKSAVLNSTKETPQ